MGRYRRRRRGDAGPGGTFPADNPFGLPAGDYRPAVAESSYALIAPLKRGVHTIIFRGSGNAGGPFSQDIT